MRNRFKRSDFAIVVPPNGIIQRHNATVQGKVIWGEIRDGQAGRPAWLTPEQMRQTKHGSFVILPHDNLAPVALPGETRVQPVITRLSAAMGEQYSLRNFIAMTKDKLAVALALVLVLIVLSVSLAAGTLYVTWQRVGNENQTIENQSPQSTPQINDRRS